MCRTYFAHTRAPGTTEILREMRGRVVMVTGAAGSIGSELCRQVAASGPTRLSVRDLRTALFQPGAGNARQIPFRAISPEIGNVQNRRASRSASSATSPPGLSCAAYKHVPMMESQVFEALENNVFGTYNVALAAPSMK